METPVVGRLCDECGLDMDLIRAMADEPQGSPDRAMADALMGCCVAIRQGNHCDH